MYKQIPFYGEKTATFSQYFTHPRYGRGDKYRRNTNRIYPKLVRPEMGKKGKDGKVSIANIHISRLSPNDGGRATEDGSARKRGNVFPTSPKLGVS